MNSLYKNSKAKRFSLEKLKRWPSLKRYLNSVKVLIYSGGLGAWWRDGAHGYTDDIRQAGIFTFEDAFERSSHCGPEKQIWYDLI